MEIIWKESETNLKVTQVYGIVFDKLGRVLLKVENKKGKKSFSFAGGHPESFDKTFEATLRREFVEEINTTLKEGVYYIGHQEVREEGKEPYAQVRMTALIDTIGPVKPDDDNGEVYERVLCHYKKAITYLGWGEVAEKQITAAVKMAESVFGLTFEECEEEWV